MSAKDIRSSFIGVKANKLRWRPEHLNESSYFVTGSWNNRNKNELSLWHYSPEKDEFPKLIGSHPHLGDVTELRFINSNSFVVSSSLGSVKMFRINVESPNPFQELASWEKIHQFKSGDFAPCTGLACFEGDIASVGEDGRIVLLTAKEKKVVYTLNKADTCSLRTVTFPKHNQIITGNLRGQLKVWDLNSSLEKPESTLVLNDDQIGVSCLTFHPTQRHLVLAGREDGSISEWDLRNQALPITLLSAHSALVSELIFHPDQPDNLFSCSHSGEMWHWSISTQGLRLHNEIQKNDSFQFNSGLSKQKLEVFSLMTELDFPINSLDANRGNVACSADNGALYIIKNVI